MVTLSLRYKEANIPPRVYTIFTVFLIPAIIAISLILWITNILIVVENNADSSEDAISPSRWFVSVAIPILFAYWGLRKHNITIGGALLGLIMGFILTISSYAFLFSLVAFFISSSQATKFRSDEKRKFEDKFDEGSKRTWIQVLCNGGMPTLLAVFYIVDSGCGERPIDFDKDYHSSWLSMGILGSFAAACGDTWASELGSVFNSKIPVLVTSLKPVPRGTNGGISGPGLWFSFVGGLLIGICYYMSIILTVDRIILERSAPQWYVIILGGMAGLVGSLLDSFLGATLQYSGIHEESGIIVEYPGDGITHISGSRILDNHSVNLITNILMGIITPNLANSLWI